MKLAALTTTLLLGVFAWPSFAQEVTRKDFQEFCQAFEGRWVGDVTWVADWPGWGKKGDKVTAYSQNTVTEDGNAMVTKFYGGTGAGTGLIAFDALAKQIKWMWVSSGGYVGHSTLQKINADFRSPNWNDT